jgi:hypothetical protein
VHHEILREFLARFVIRAFEDFKKSPADEYLGKTAVHHANVLAERVWQHYKSENPAKVFQAQSVSLFRDAIAEHLCPEFALIRDVDDGFKHLILDRKSRRVTSADQVGFEPTIWGRFYWGQARWGGQVVIRADDGSRWDLLDTLAKVVGMWDQFLPSGIRN